MGKERDETGMVFRGGILVEGLVPSSVGRKHERQEEKSAQQTGQK